MVDGANYDAKLGNNSPSTEPSAVLVGAPAPAVVTNAAEPIDRSVSDDLFPLGRRSAEPPASQAPSTERDGTASTGVPFSFGPPPPAACSTSRCGCGHVWRPELRIATCPGCAAPMLVLLMQNCPACNEPTSATNLRLDHMPQASGQLMPICRGAATLAEPILIELRHTHAADEEARHVVREVVSKV